MLEFKFTSKDDENVKKLTFDELRPKYDELNKHLIDYPNKDHIRKSIEEFYDIVKNFLYRLKSIILFTKFLFFLFSSI